MAASPLTYPTADFRPFTKMLSAEVNDKFTAIKTLLNTTKLSDTNVQTGGLSYDRLTVTTSLQIVGTSSAGVMTTQAVVLVGQGGTGLAYTVTTVDVGKVMQVNQAGTALTLDTVPLEPSIRMYQFSRFL